MSIISIKSKPTTVNVKQDQWQKLRKFTQARIALGRVGSSTPTDELLKFQLAHAQAIDAVHHTFDIPNFIHECGKLPELKMLLPAYQLSSKVKDRFEYLQRPDLGRSLDDISRKKLHQTDGIKTDCTKWDLAFVIADGLSSYAIEKNAIHFLEQFMSKAKDKKFQIAPLSIVK